jgi:uncharacterized membrane protein YidH (DUF202 family)
MMVSRAPNVGLQRERTSLAWTRTALALVANGLLVLVRHERPFPLGLALGLSALWLGMALVVLWHASRRGRRAWEHDHEIGADYRFLVPLAMAVAGLCAATALAIFFT